jgi:membrane-bound metal-dependent hydrolase YbcI (DUF457 family)
MAFPAAHGLLGATAVILTAEKGKEINYKRVALGAFLGVLPDFDYLLNWLNVGGGGWHHGFSHSLMFALIVGSIIAFVIKDFNSRTIFGLSLATASHGILDFFITESKGIALLSPFTNYRFKLELFSPIDYRWAGENTAQIVFNILQIFLIELVIFLPLLLIVIWFRQKFYKNG